MLYTHCSCSLANRLQSLLLFLVDLPTINNLKLQILPFLSFFSFFISLIVTISLSTSTLVYHCVELCRSGCKNGGVCIGPNLCSCPHGFRSIKVYVEGHDVYFNPNLNGQGGGSLRCLSYIFVLEKKCLTITTGDHKL